jgi:hypothetical protein
MAKNNLLTMSPVLKPKLTLESLAGDSSLYQVLIPRTNLLERFSIRYLKQPTHHRVRLDQFGSFVLCHCTGEYAVEQIENLMATEFGITAEPIRERLVTFLSIVEANGWIQWVSS